MESKKEVLIRDSAVYNKTIVNANEFKGIDSNFSKKSYLLADFEKETHSVPGTILIIAMV